MRFVEGTSPFPWATTSTSWKLLNMSPKRIVFIPLVGLRGWSKSLVGGHCCCKKLKIKISHKKMDMWRHNPWEKEKKTLANYFNRACFSSQSVPVGDAAPKDWNRCSKTLKSEMMKSLLQNTQVWNPYSKGPKCWSQTLNVYQSLREGWATTSKRNLCSICHIIRAVRLSPIALTPHADLNSAWGRMTAMCFYKAE